MLDLADVRAELRAARAIATKEIRIARRYPLSLANEVLQPIYQFLLPSLLLGATFAVGGRALGLRTSTGTDDLAGFLFLGIVVGGLVGAAFWDVALSFKREMDTGTLEPAWLTPTRPETLVIGRALAAVAIGGIATIVLVVIGLGAFGATFSAGIWLAMPAIVLAGISMLGIGYLVASAVFLLREPSFFVDATNFLFSMASGVAFPITVLPICAADRLRAAHDVCPRPLATPRARDASAPGSSPRMGGTRRVRDRDHPLRTLGLPAHRAPPARPRDPGPTLTWRDRRGGRRPGPDRALMPDR